MKHFLVTFRDNWADEFDMSGFQIMTEKEIEDLKERAEKYFKKHSSYEEGFGTNESFEWSSLEDIMSTLTFKEITDEQVKVIDELFSWHEQGYFPNLEFYDYDDEGDDEEYED